MSGHTVFELLVFEGLGELLEEFRRRADQACHRGAAVPARKIDNICLMARRLRTRRPSRCRSSAPGVHALHGLESGTGGRRSPQISAALRALHLHLADEPFHGLRGGIDGS